MTLTMSTKSKDESVRCVCWAVPEMIDVFLR